MTSKKRQDLRVQLQKRARRRAEKKVEYLEDDKNWKEVSSADPAQTRQLCLRSVLQELILCTWVCGLDWRLRGRGFDFWPFRFHVTTLGKSSLSPSSVNWYRSNGGDAPYDWEGNRRSDVALAVRHRLKWFIHLWTERPTEQDE